MTIAGLHTVHELSDFIASAQYQRNQINSAYLASGAKWEAADKTGYLAFSTNFLGSEAKWDTVLADSKVIMASATASTTPSWDVVIANTYDDVVDAFADLASYDRMLRAANKQLGPGIITLPSYPNNPQPTAPDADLGAYNLLPSNPVASLASTLKEVAIAAAILTGVAWVWKRWATSLLKL